MIPDIIRKILCLPLIPETNTIIKATIAIIDAILKLFSISTNTENAPAKGDKTIAEWSKVLVREDAAFVAEHRAEMEDFIQSIAQ